MGEIDSRVLATFAKPYHFQLPERHSIAMREIAETITMTSNNGQQFNGVYVNRDFDDGKTPVHIRPNNMFSSSKDVDQKYIAYQEAAAFPDRPVVIIDQPEIMTDSQSKAVKKSGSLALIAEAELQAVSNRVNNANQIVLTGEAFGARMAIEMATKAKYLDLEPLHLISFDPVGLENRSSAGLTWGYLIRAPRSRNLYTEGEANAILQSDYIKFQDELNTIAPDYSLKSRDAIDIFKRHPGLIKFLFRNSPLANNGGQLSLDKAVKDNLDMGVDIIFGKLSVVGRKTETVTKHLAYLDLISHAGVDWTVWPHDNQGMSLAMHRPFLTGYEKHKLRPVA